MQVYYEKRDFDTKKLFMQWFLSIGKKYCKAVFIKLDHSFIWLYCINRSHVMEDRPLQVDDGS